MNLVENIIEIGFSMSLFVNALLFLPQTIKLLKTKSTQGLSLLTFGGFNIIQIFAISHGYIKHDYVLLFGFSLSFLACSTVTFLILYYKIKAKPKKSPTES